MMQLREMTRNDLPFLLEVRNDKSTRRWLENNKKFTLKQCEKWFENLKSKWFIIEDNTVKVGYVRTSDETDVSIYIGCDIHPDSRRRYYASQALKMILDKYNDKNIFLWVFLNNAIAYNLYMKLGFQITGREKVVRNQIYLEMQYNPF